MTSKKEMLKVAQWNFDGVALEFIPKRRTGEWLRYTPAHILDFDQYHYRRKPSEPVIMYAPYNDKCSGDYYDGHMSDALFKTPEELYKACGDSIGYVEVKVFLK